MLSLVILISPSQPSPPCPPPPNSEHKSVNNSPRTLTSDQSSTLFKAPWSHPTFPRLSSNTTPFQPTNSSCMTSTVSVYLVGPSGLRSSTTTTTPPLLDIQASNAPLN